MRAPNMVTTCGCYTLYAAYVGFQKLIRAEIVRSYVAERERFRSR